MIDRACVGSFDNSVVGCCHRYSLRCIPVNRSENDRGDRIYLTAHSDIDGNVSSRFSVKGDFVTACRAAFGSIGARRCDRNAGRTGISDIVIGDADGDGGDRNWQIFRRAADGDAVVNRACVQPFY